MPFPNRETQFQPGQSGNPGGRPKGVSLTTLIHELLKEEVWNGKSLKGRKVADLLAKKIVQRAVQGDYRFVELVINRIDGKVPTLVAINSPSHETTELVRDFLLGATDTPDSTG
jgi:hypothetical protein